jgi:hypothetical protein
MYSSYTVVLLLTCGSNEDPRFSDLDDLEFKLRRLREALPEELQLLAENTATHVFEVESPGIYIRIHALYQICIVEMARALPTQPFLLSQNPFFEMLHSFHESFLGASRARIPVAGFAAYSVSRSTYFSLRFHLLS